MTTTVLPPRQIRGFSLQNPPKLSPTTVADETPSATRPQMRCPACGEEAVVEWRDMAAGTSGPVVHVKLRCPRGRHWFLMLEENL